MHKKPGRENDSVEVIDTPEKSEAANREETILAFWNEHDIFHKSLRTPAGAAPKGEYVFYDGPPFATGLPHYGHLLAGTIKDAVPRFWTMQGYHVRRQWGWDCHGLPVEHLIEKKLGLASKRDIEAYGIKDFNEAARSSVLEYAEDWRQIIPRMGRFVDMEDDYRTMDSTYTESVWWTFKALHEKGLVYEGFKSMHLCPRCGTTLSNFEVNQGYKDIKDISVTVKLPLLDEKGKVTDTALLVWTTTPWTLPGNLAAAVHKDHEYAVVTTLSEETAVPQRYIVAKERVAAVFSDQAYEIVEECMGADLLGKQYEPPFPWLAEQEYAGKERAWQVYHADFVEIGEEGTGIVHIAPAYGDDDLALAQAHNVPIMHHVDAAGHFMSYVADFAGQLVKPKDDDEADVTHMDADIEIIKALAARGRLFSKEKITHSYPHCWRCDTPLLNYATTSWFVEVTKIRDELVAANQAVQWMPEYGGSNRFGKWLEGARDWAVSRQRYWGAPLPIWRNPKTESYHVFGSLAELQEYVPKSGNRYLISRHGESVLNTKHILNVDASVENGLTECGKTQLDALVDTLQSEQIDYIYYSPLQRTRESAEHIAAALGLPKEVLIADERLLEMSFGEFEGQSVDAYHAFFATGAERLTKRPAEGENWTDVKQRTGELLYELEVAHRDKTILFVSHNGTLQMLQAAATGEDAETAGSHIIDNSYDLENAELRPVPFVPVPHNDAYELDFHRPYIDTIALYENEVQLERVPDVFDCWFESGAMPYGQYHYPFEEATQFEANRFPAQFIAEGLDQTRGWFYSLMVLGVALFGRSPYEQVIVNGLVLAEDGKKMSKSLQNYPDPMELVDRHGADAMRFYLLSSPIIKGEDLNFSEQEVQEIQRKNIGRLHNVLAMYELFADDTAPDAGSDHVLDQWILSRCNQLITEVTTGYQTYELDKATRPISEFIDDLSVWYLRRSRDRLKGEDLMDRTRTLATLRHVLQVTALVTAPAMPFYAEYLWQAVRKTTDAESVHVAAWPTAGSVDAGVLAAMQQTREVVTAALELRAKANVKVRQPLAELSIGAGITLSEAYASIIESEVNVKKVTFAPDTTAIAALDTTITPELKAEGAVRELIREIQKTRKAQQLTPEQSIVLRLDGAGERLVSGFEAELQRVVGATEIATDALSEEPYSIEINGTKYLFEVEPIT